jgi:hypothetical protein
MIEDIEDIKKNVTAKLNAAPLDAFSDFYAVFKGCKCVMLTCA